MDERSDEKMYLVCRGVVEVADPLLLASQWM